MIRIRRLTGILFQLPTGLSSGGLLSIASEATQGNADAYTSGFQGIVFIFVAGAFFLMAYSCWTARQRLNGPYSGSVHCRCSSTSIRIPTKRNRSLLLIDIINVLYNHTEIKGLNEWN